MDRYGDLQKAILDNIPDQAWLKDRESRYILVNDAFMAACGLSEAAILHRTPADIWPREWGEKYQRTDREVLRSGQRSRYEESRYSTDGVLRWFDTIKTPIRDAAGAVIGTAGISRDITDRKAFEQALARLNRLYAVRSRTNQAIARVASVDALYYAVCRIAVQSGGLQLAWIGDFDDAAPSALPAATFSRNGKRERAFLAHLHDCTPDERIGLNAFAGKIFVCGDTAEPTHFKAHAAAAHARGFGSFAAVALTRAKRRIGIFMLYAQERDFFTPDMLQLLRALGADLGFALDSLAQAGLRKRAEEALLASRAQLRELSAYLQSVREEERARISRELHDELGQSLTAIRIGLSVIETQRGNAEKAATATATATVDTVDTANTASSPEGAAPGAEDWRKHLQMLKGIADRTVESVQRIAADLRPPILDELGLGAALEWLLESVAEHSGIACRLVRPPPLLEVGHDVATAIFRIVQEALTNACRHGRASAVEVAFQDTAERIVLRIDDDGCGMDLQEAGQRKRLGLVGMRERALMLGGRLAIHSTPGGGTHIEVSIPKPLAARAEAS